MNVVFAALLASENLNDGVKASNPILPETHEIVWSVVAFVLVFAVLAWKAWPAISKSLSDREAKIRADLDAAEGARVEAESSLETYKQQLADARGDAGRIIDEARQAADDVRRELIARAEADSADLRTRAQEDIRQATERAMVDLQARLADLSIELAQRIVERNLDRDTQIALIESYINEVASTQK
ncbi:MAG: ATP synthase F0 subunit B [Acidimicrobiia bacterium]|nr:ATP synthase F0 subunit B [Acidimicrobiia bacterium]